MQLPAEVIANSVAAQRRRAPVRRVANTTTSQVDFEDRRSELQRYLVQQRKRQDLLHGGRPAGSSGQHGGGATSVNEPPPYCETPSGQLQARRRYLPKSSIAVPSTGQGQHTSMFGKPKGSPSLLLKVWALIVYGLSLIPSKYLWVAFGLTLLNARRLISFLVPYQDTGMSASSTVPIPTQDA